MPRAKPEPRGTEFGTKVPTEEYLKFRRRFPQYGSVNWFINTVLQKFNKLCDAQPDAEVLLQRSINEMLAERRGADMTNLP